MQVTKAFSQKCVTRTDPHSAHAHPPLPPDAALLESTVEITHVSKSESQLSNTYDPARVTANVYLLAR